MTINIDNQHKAKTYVDKAIVDLIEAANLLKIDEIGEVYHIISSKTKMIVGEKPTFLTAKNFAIDYEEDHKDEECFIDKHMATIKK